MEVCFSTRKQKGKLKDCLETWKMDLCLTVGLLENEGILITYSF